MNPGAGGSAGCLPILRAWTMDGSSKGDRALSLPIILIPHPHVSADPNVLGGSPFVTGTRVPVRRLWAFYRNGARVETILKRYPQLGAARVLDALAFALDNPEVMEADLQREQLLLNQVSQRSSSKASGARPSGAGVVGAEQIELPFAPTAPRKRR